MKLPKRIRIHAKAPYPYSTDYLDHVLVLVGGKEKGLVYKNTTVESEGNWSFHSLEHLKKYCEIIPDEFNSKLEEEIYDLETIGYR